MKYAVIISGNKQYKVSEGDIIEVEQLSVEAQDSYTFSKVLLYVDGENKTIGTPILTDIVVTGGVVGNLKGKKVRVAKFKAKARYRRVRGFRPSITQIKIEKIELKEKSKKMSSEV